MRIEEFDSVVSAKAAFARLRAVGSDSVRKMQPHWPLLLTCEWCEQVGCKCACTPCFASFLETYCAPRPKTYSDRKWLEGYCETARTLHGIHFYPIPGRIITKQRITATINEMLEKNLTARGCGQIDAWLDAVGY